MKFPMAVMIAIIVSASAGCLGPMPELFPPAQGEPADTIYVVNHGWHTGIAVPSGKLPPFVVPPWDAAQRSRYLEIGWGDDEYYRAEKVTSGMTIRAMVGANLSVLHVVAMKDDPDVGFPSSGIIKVIVSVNGFMRLCSFLAESFAVDSNGDMIDLGKGLYGTSRFYRATGRFYFPNTCNTWTARALRAAGAPITPIYAVTAENVFSQCRKFGEIIREPPQE